MNPTPENGMEGEGSALVAPLKIPQPFLEQLFTDSLAASWGLSRKAFALALGVSAKKRFGSSVPPIAALGEYLSSLHVQDLALACACAEGHSAAWDHFVATFRGYLRSTAAVLLRCPADSPGAADLADGLFAELYGISDRINRRSLFRYFHGRSSLKTWLRAVLAQRHIDSIRASRRFTELETTADDGVATVARQATFSTDRADGSASPADPHRDDLLAAFRRTLEVALGLLEPGEKERLRRYYAAEQTLAEIGRKLGEHESSVSRNLERTRRELRHQVEHALAATGLSEDQISLCFEYASQESPIDLDKLLPESPAMAHKPESKKP